MRGMERKKGRFQDGLFYGANRVAMSPTRWNRLPKRKPRRGVIACL